ncbi:hypothetical protein JCM6882_002442 [Rhodosporidiobolus microsporus]
MPSSLNDFKMAEDGKGSPPTEHATKVTVDAASVNPLVKDKVFNTFEILSLGYSVCNSWVGVAGALTIGLSQGGPALLIYGLWVCRPFPPFSQTWAPLTLFLPSSPFPLPHFRLFRLSSMLMGLIILCVGLSLSELASVYPHAGGQYVYAAMLAPPSSRRIFAFVTGFANIAAWAVISASVAFLNAQFIMAAVYFSLGITIQRWHYFLTFQGVNILGTLYVWLIAHRTPFIYQVGLYSSLVGFLVTLFGTCFGPAALHNHNSSDFVWTTLTNETGWSSSVICFITGMVNVNYAYGGFDGAIHIAAESSDPRRDIPKALLGTVALGFFTTLAWIVGILYSAQDTAAAAVSGSGVPYFDIVLQSLTAKGGVYVVISIAMVNMLVSLLACQHTSMRLIQAFANDGGLIGGKVISREHEKYGSAGWALLFNSFWVFLIGCLYLASTTVYQAIIGSTLILSHISYAIPVFLLMCRGRKLPQRPYISLGAFGWIANAVTVIWAIIALVFYSFPAGLPVTGTSMNYCSVVIAIVGLFGLANWLATKKHFAISGLMEEE